MTMRSTAILCCLLFAALPALAVDRVTATLTFTDLPAAGETLVVNSDTRTWYGTVTNLATEVLIGASGQASATNLWLHVARTPFAGPITTRWISTNEIAFQGASGLALSLTATGWGSISYSTQTVSALVGVRVPLSSEPSAVRTNVATQMVLGISSYAIQPFDEYSVAMDSFVGRSSVQTVSGDKTWTGANVFGDITTTNLVNYGAAISSPGSGALSEQFGTSATATNALALAIGYQALAGGSASTAVGNDAEATAAATVSLGKSASASAANSVALGSSASASGVESVALGNQANAIHDYSVAIGSLVSSTSTNQITLGDATYSTLIPWSATISGTARIATLSGTVGTLTNGTLSGPTITGAMISGSTYSGTVGSLTNGYLYGTGANTMTVTNLTVASGTNTWTGQLAFTRYDSTSLANGQNAGIDFGSSAVYVVINGGPTAAFSLNGVAGGRNGRVLIVQNATGQDMTIANESGLDPTAANRIYTGSGADLTITGQGAVTLIYDSDASRWWVTTSTQGSSLASLTVTGTLTTSNLVYSGTYWDDAMVGPLSLKGAAVDPDLIPLDTGGATTNTAIYGFDAGTLEAGYMTIQLSHRYKEGTILYPHVHWCQTAAPGAGNTNVVWGLEYTVATPFSAFPATTTVYVTNGVSTTNWFHQISSFPTISGTGLKVSSVINARLFRNAADAADTYASDAGFLGFDLHFQVDSPGSRSETTK